MFKFIKIVVLIAAGYRFWMAFHFWNEAQKFDPIIDEVSRLTFETAYELNTFYTIALAVFAFKFKESDE